jgi:hypothetical protein
MQRRWQYEANTIPYMLQHNDVTKKNKIEHLLKVCDVIITYEIES